MLFGCLELDPCTATLGTHRDTVSSKGGLQKGRGGWVHRGKFAQTEGIFSGAKGQGTPT